MSGFVNGKAIKDASINIKNKLNRQAHTTTSSDGKDIVNVEFLKAREAGLSFDDSVASVVTVKNADGTVVDSFNVGGGTPASATETVEGIIKTSTVQQLIDGTNDAVAVTPKDLKTAGYVRDLDYVHTDNNLTDEGATKLSELEILKEPVTGYIVKSKIVPFTRGELMGNNYVLQHNLNVKRYLSQWFSFSPLGFGSTGNTKVSYTPSDLEASALATVHVIDENSIKLDNFVYPWNANELNDVVYYMVQYISATEIPLVSGLGCNTASTLSPIIEGQSVGGNTLTINYTGGNGKAYNGQVININGMTLTLASGTLTNGNGSIVFTMTGTPSVIGYVNIPMNFAGQSCTVTLTVVGSSSQLTGTNPQDGFKGLIHMLDTLDFSFDKNIQLGDSTKTVKIYNSLGSVVRTFHPSDFQVSSGKNIICQTDFASMGLPLGDYYATIDTGFVIDSTTGQQVIGNTSNTFLNFSICDVLVSNDSPTTRYIAVIIIDNLGVQHEVYNGTTQSPLTITNSPFVPFTNSTVSLTSDGTITEATLNGFNYDTAPSNDEVMWNNKSGDYLEINFKVV